MEMVRNWCCRPVIFCSAVVRSCEETVATGSSDAQTVSARGGCAEVVMKRKPTRMTPMETMINWIWSTAVGGGGGDDDAGTPHPLIDIETETPGN